MSRVRVESAVKIKNMSRVRVESRWSSFESELSQVDTAWVKVEALVFLKRNVKILHLSVVLQGKNQHPTTFGHPLPGQQLLAKLGKMWWVVSQIWFNSDSNELSQSWVKLGNLWFELSQSRKVKCWVESELSHLDCQMSQSRVSLKIWVEHKPWLYAFHLTTSWPVGRGVSCCPSGSDRGTHSREKLEGD